MALAMTRPFKHPKTGVYYFRKGVPEHLRPLVGKREVKISLGTKRADQARELHAAIANQTAQEWAKLEVGDAEPGASKSGSRVLTDEEVVGLSGSLYREMMETHGTNPGLAHTWEAKLRELQLALPAHLRLEDFVPPLKPDWSTGPALMAGRILGQHCNAFTDRHDIGLEWRSRNRFYASAAMSLAQAYRELIKRARGDFRPDPDADRFPPSPLNALPATTWTQLYAEYAKKSEVAASTEKRQRGVLSALFLFLGHSDPAKVSEEDARRWIDHRLTEAGVSPRTVRDADLAHPKILYRWGVENKKLSGNPFDGIRVRVPKPVKLREREYTFDEAERVLAASLIPTSGRMTVEGAAARRWVPWLCAYTGARVNELTQLRACDIFGEGVPSGKKVWLVKITPEAGTTKNKEARNVALHPDLLAQGFLDYVKSRKGKHLFYEPARGRGGSQANPQYKKAGERLAAWVRKDVGITDLGIDPNHAWRHLFRSNMLATKLQEQVLNRIDGHAAKDVAGTYGSAWPEVMLEAISQIPPYLKKRPRPFETS